MPPMPEPYRRIVCVSRAALNAHARYTGYERTLTEFAPLPETMRPRLGRFIIDHLSQYEPFVDELPTGDDRYMSHSFVHELWTGRAINPADAYILGQELADRGKFLRDPERTLQPGNIGVFTDRDEGFALQSFISLGGEDTLQVVDANSHIGRATLNQMLRHYNAVGIDAGVKLADPAMLV